MIEDICKHPIFIAIFAQAIAGGVIILALVRFILPAMLSKILSRQQIVLEGPAGSENHQGKAYLRFCVQDCSEHQVEHERSLRNQERVAALELRFSELRDELKDGLSKLREAQFIILWGLKEKGMIELPPGYIDIGGIKKD